MFYISFDVLILEYTMYQIGQILYIVLNKKMVILPVKIIEETNTKKLINGKTENVIHYVVKTKETNGFKLLKLEEIDGEIFTNKKLKINLE